MVPQRGYVIGEGHVLPYTRFGRCSQPNAALPEAGRRRHAVCPDISWHSTSHSTVPALLHVAVADVYRRGLGIGVELWLLHPRYHVLVHHDKLPWPPLIMAEALTGTPRRVLVLCFDGTGNKFNNNGGDSNIIKIYSLLDHASPHVYRYYQPGIGTYIEDSALSKTSRIAKVHSAYKKVKDQMYGISFDEHVRAGYLFLMRYYEEDADIYMFGFSRGV